MICNSHWCNLLAQCILHCRWSFTHLAFCTLAVLQAEADAARQELEMAHMASATAAANFQEHTAELRAKLEAAERQLRYTIKQFFCLLIE